MALRSCSWLCEEPLVEVMRTIWTLAYELQADFDLFYHNPTGDLMLSVRYFEHQEEYIRDKALGIFRRFIEVIEFIKEKVSLNPLLQIELKHPH